MAISATITVDDASGDDVNYVTQRVTSDGIVRLDPTSTLSEPATLVIKHTSSGKGKDAVDRHLVQVTETVLETDGTPRIFIANFTMQVPRSSVISSTIVHDRCANLIDCIMAGGLTTLTTTFIDDILLGLS